MNGSKTQPPNANANANQAATLSTTSLKPTGTASSSKTTHSRISEFATPIAHIAIVTFHHIKGNLLTYLYPPSDLPSENWKLNLAFSSMPDGCHNFESSWVNLMIPHYSDPKMWLFGVSCFRQAPASNFIHSPGVIPDHIIGHPSDSTNSDATATPSYLPRQRSKIQKAVIVLSTVPLYSVILSKLSPITREWFESRDLENKDLLEGLFTMLNVQISTILTASIPKSLSNPDLAVKQSPLALSIRDSFDSGLLFDFFGTKTLLLFKLLLLQTSTIFHCSKPAHLSASLLLNLIDLVPSFFYHLTQFSTNSINPPPNTKEPIFLNHSKYFMPNSFGFPLNLFENHSPYLYISTARRIPKILSIWSYFPLTSLHLLGGHGKAANLNESPSKIPSFFWFGSSNPLFREIHNFPPTPPPPEIPNFTFRELSEMTRAQREEIATKIAKSIETSHTPNPRALVLMDALLAEYYSSLFTKLIQMSKLRQTYKAAIPIVSAPSAALKKLDSVFSTNISNSVPYPRPRTSSTASTSGDNTAHNTTDSANSTANAGTTSTEPSEVPNLLVSEPTELVEEDEPFISTDFDSDNVTSPFDTPLDDLDDLDDFEEMGELNVDTPSIDFEGLPVDSVNPEQNPNVPTPQRAGEQDFTPIEQAFISVVDNISSGSQKISKVFTSALGTVRAAGNHTASEYRFSKSQNEAIKLLPGSTITCPPPYDDKSNFLCGSPHITPADQESEPAASISNATSTFSWIGAGLDSFTQFAETFTKMISPGETSETPSTIPVFTPPDPKQRISALKQACSFSASDRHFITILESDNAKHTKKVLKRQLDEIMERNLDASVSNANAENPLKTTTEMSQISRAIHSTLTTYLFETPSSPQPRPASIRIKNAFKSWLEQLFSLLCMLPNVQERILKVRANLGFPIDPEIVQWMDDAETKMFVASWASKRLLEYNWAFCKLFMKTDVFNDWIATQAIYQILFQCEKIVAKPISLYVAETVTLWIQKKVTIDFRHPGSF